MRLRAFAMKAAKRSDSIGWKTLSCILLGTGLVMGSSQHSVIFRASTLELERSPVKVSEGLTVIPEQPADLERALAAFAASSKSGASVRSRGPASIISVGPILDIPDEVEAGELHQRGTALELEIRYTNARLLGVNLRRNVQWRPVVVTPLNLAPGSYDLIVTWRPVKQLPSTRLEDLALVAPTVQRLSVRASDL